MIKTPSLTKEERKAKQLERMKAGRERGEGVQGTELSRFFPDDATDDERFKTMMARNEDELLQFVAKVNKVYQEHLNRPAPFMTFVFFGMQSSGKSTIMERFLNSVLNIVQEGTGTRCPLDATCIHDDRYEEPMCELRGSELPDDMKGGELKVDEVFKRIMEHNKSLAASDTFSTEPLVLVYRASNVQNMRFVDTPGIITNQSTGADNREQIKTILRHEMKKPNTKLCVLLEPKEFATNPIVNFCDESLGGRDNWIHDTTFLMTKYDKQLDDSRSVAKANRFFQEFFDNKCFPHLVITPTLAKENIPREELYQARLDLIRSADDYEKNKFEIWEQGHEFFRLEHGDSEELHVEVSTRIGFQTAKTVMREIMLRDTIERLPEVISSLRSDLDRCNANLQVLMDKKEYSDPKTLRLVISHMLGEMQAKVLNYLDGDLQVSLKFPQALQTLEEEIWEEEESDWNLKRLNYHSEKEDEWRSRIGELEDLPSEVQPDSKFLGGKQYQRAVEFFRYVMIDSLPDPYELKDLVANATGYLSGGLQQENWERAMVEITKTCLKDVSHPGINYLIKHVGSIFRRLFQIALNDIKQGEEFSARYKLIPHGVERFLLTEFDDMLWSVLKETANQAHLSTEPMYSTIDPTLPTFHAQKLTGEDDGDRAIEQESHGMAAYFKTKVAALAARCGGAAKDFLKQENRERATRTWSLMPDARTAMITGEESEIILQRSYEYIVGLFEFNIIVYKFHMNHHLYVGFKNALQNDFRNRIIDAKWEELIHQEAGIDQKISVLNAQIKALTDSLNDVKRMQRSL